MLGFCTSLIVHIDPGGAVLESMRFFRSRCGSVSESRFPNICVSFGILAPVSESRPVNFGRSVSESSVSFGILAPVSESRPVSFGSSVSESSVSFGILAPVSEYWFRNRFLTVQGLGCRV